MRNKIYGVFCSGGDNGEMLMDLLDAFWKAKIEEYNRAFDKKLPK